MAGEEKRSRRELQVRDDLWEAFGRMAGETGFSRDALINEAMKQFARSRGYGSAPKPVPTHDDYSGPHAMEPTSSRHGRTRPPPLPSDPAPKRLYLHFNGQRYFVDPTEDFIIGRARTGCHLTIKDPNISRRHAAIAYRNGSYYLQDLGSVNGIDFHGESVDHKRIENGDSFKLCEYELVFSFQDA
jgi:hypothetical protein